MYVPNILSLPSIIYADKQSGSHRISIKSSQYQDNGPTDSSLINTFHIFGKTWWKRYTKTHYFYSKYFTCNLSHYPLFILYFIIYGLLPLIYLLMLFFSPGFLFYSCLVLQFSLSFLSFLFKSYTI